jgi:hypothetical protein
MQHIPLDAMMLPGDVLVASDGGRLVDIGRAGGFLGHVLIIASRPRCIPRHSSASREFESLWPGHGVAEIWAVDIVESFRGAEGLHEATILLYVEEDGRLILFGERSLHHGLWSQDHEALQLWQSPAELRTSLRIDLMMQALSEMRAQIGASNWSVTTAARALFTSATLNANESKAEVAACWKQEPICTSVVISLWQRYLCKFAEVTKSTSPIDLIRRWMPLKADRGLPGELLTAMSQAGWVCVVHFAPSPPVSKAELPVNKSLFDVPLTALSCKSQPKTMLPNQSPVIFTPAVRPQIAPLQALHAMAMAPRHPKTAWKPTQVMVRAI